MTTKNLGLVKAIFESTTPPTNISVIWRDTSLTTPLHKYYNTVSVSWEAFIYSTLIDNLTIEKNGSNQLYVDISEIPALVIPDSSITLIKLADVASGTVFYRKTAGAGVPELQTLAILKEDLGLSGDNNGDQDLTGLVSKLTEINGYPLSGDIDLNANDVGAPTGSGSSTNTNTGDETEGSILIKLNITSISGENTGDQDAGGISIEDVGGVFDAVNVEGALQEVKLLADANIGGADIQEITLPAATSVQGRIDLAVEGVDYPTGWVLETGTTLKDLLITHSLSRNVANATVFVFTTSVDTQMKIGSAAFTGLYNYNSNSTQIQSLCTSNSKLSINLLFN